MAGEWREYRIGEIADIVGGSTPSTSDPSNFNGDIPWITPKDLSGPHDRYVSRGERNLSRKGLESCSAQLLPRGTVLVTSRAPIGYVAIAKNPITTNQGFRNLVPKPGVDSEFLYYWVKANVEELRRHASGSTFQELSGTALAQIGIRLPPLPEQRAIAHILGTLDDKIELNRRMSETLEAMARALFKAWFVDFEPVRAKMEGRWQRGQSLPGLPAHLYDLFPDRLVDSELGEISEGWSVGTLAEIVELVRDHVNPLSEPASEFLHFSIPAFDEGRWPKLERGEEIKSQKWQVPPEVVLLSKLNPEIERVWLVDVKPDDRAVCSTEFLVLRPKPPYGRAYVYCLTRSPLFRQQIEGLVTGTSKRQQRAQPSPILELATIKPSAPVVTAFDRVAASLLDRSLECRRESRTLAALRDALLPKLIRGEIRVKDAERFLKERGYGANPMHIPLA